MILTKQIILEEIKNKNITIKPFKKENIGPASIDLTLANTFRIFSKQKELEPSKENYKRISKVVKTSKIILEPKQFVLGITRERIKLPSNIAGFLTGRSTNARYGLFVHATASFVQPGINNKQVLEIFNASDNRIILKEGMKICQLILFKCKGSARYLGRYKNQLTI